ALKIGARAKLLALGRKDKHPARRLLVERFERIGEIADQRVVKIVVRRAMDLQRRHVVAVAYFDRYVSVLVHRATRFLGECNFTNRSSAKVSTAQRRAMSFGTPGVGELMRS